MEAYGVALPAEVLCHIFVMAGLGTVHRLRRVCHHWRDLIDGTNEIWSRFHSLHLRNRTGTGLGSLDQVWGRARPGAIRDVELVDCIRIASDPVRTMLRAAQCSALVRLKVSNCNKLTPQTLPPHKVIALCPMISDLWYDFLFLVYTNITSHKNNNYLNARREKFKLVL